MIVWAHAQDAYRQMDALYAQHEWTGKLRRSLTVVRDEEYLRFGTRAIVKNTAPHAWWAEHGTQIRKDSHGVNRGAMPPLHIFIPIAARVRRRMEAVLIALVERAGLIVTPSSQA